MQSCMSYQMISDTKEHVLEVLGGADAGVVDEADWTVTVRPRLDLGEVDVAEGEGGEDFEEDAGALVVREDDAGFERPDVETVKLGGACGGDGGGVAEVVGGDVLRGAGGVVHGLTRDGEAEIGERELALGECLRVAYDAREVVFSDAREREEAVVDRELDLADDVEAVAEEEVVVPVNRAAERVLHRENRSVGNPELHGLKRNLKLIARNRFAIRIRLSGRRFTVSAGNALIRHTELRAVQRRRREIRNRQGIRKARALPIRPSSADDAGEINVTRRPTRVSGVEATLDDEPDRKREMAKLQLEVLYCEKGT
nr:hypothetical protein CR513_54080 [Ipomoea batatas]